ncbi:MAG: hypothetical protein LBU40_00900, partial [Methanobrevibacter sp.]|nr:hypothetical protein [Methanobrevibacter sp.]
GFQIDDGNLKISYTSDTKYFDDLSEYHKNADILIASVLRPAGRRIRGHMGSEDFLKLVEEIQPKLAIMTHFGFKIIQANPQKEADFIQGETGIDTIAAFDGMRINLDNINLDGSYELIHLNDRFKHNNGSKHSNNRNIDNK